MRLKGPMKPYLISSEGDLVGKSVPQKDPGCQKIRFLCPSCGKSLKAGSEAVGMKGRCPECGNVFSIPHQSARKIRSQTTEKSVSDDNPTNTDNQTESDNEDWDASVWKYYGHYISNVISKGSELGKHIKHIGFWWRCFQHIIDLAPAAILIFLLRPDFDRHFWYSASICGSVFLFQTILWSVLESSDFQGSLGKIVLEFRVTTESGHQISLKRAFVRNIVKAIMFVPPLCVLFLLIGIDRKKRGLHDRAANTVVVMESPTAFSWRNERRWVVLWAFLALPFLTYFLLFM